MDISTVVSGGLDELVNKMNEAGSKDAWKARKAALDDVMAAVDKGGKFLEANKALYYVLLNVRKRVHDNQTNLKPLAVSVIVAIIGSLDLAAVPKALRLVAEGVCVCGGGVGWGGLGATNIPHSHRL